MKVSVFKADKVPNKSHFDEGEIRKVLSDVAELTDTTDLVVALYLSPGKKWGGIYELRSGTPKSFSHTKGRWAFARRFSAPSDFPQEFQLIRMILGTSFRYPLITRDCYGWEFRFQQFEEHLAWLFAHELHHFRRHHLGLHPREGEISANKWATARVKELGLDVQARPIRRRRSKATSPLETVLDAIEIRNNSNRPKRH